MAKKRKAKAKKAVKAKRPVKRKVRRAKKRKPMGTVEALIGTVGETSALRRRLAGRETFED